MNNRKENWANYWRQGVVGSCAATVKSTDSDLDLFWKRVANEIESEEIVVDLCTGAGAVIKELITLSEKSKQADSAYYKGIELSAFEGQKEVYLKELRDHNIELINNTSIEALPFDENSIDRLVSQYGVEYAWGKEFCKEVARVLKPTGKFEAVLHHKKSILYRVAEEERKHYKFITEEVNLFSTLKKIIPFFALLRNPANKAKLNNNPEAIEARNNFNGALSKIKEMAQKSNHPDLLLDLLDSASMSLNLAKTENKKIALEFVKQLKSQLDNSYYRSKELCEAALSSSDLQNYVGELSQEFKTTYDMKELYSNKEIVAWGLSVTKLS